MIIKALLNDNYFVRLDGLFTTDRELKIILRAHMIAFPDYEDQLGKFFSNMTEELAQDIIAWMLDNKTAMNWRNITFGDIIVEQ